MKKGIRIQFCIAIFFALIVPFSVFAQSFGNVKIGKQIWMSKNLDVATFRNGDTIPEVRSRVEWKKAGENYQPAWCYYNYDQKNGTKYGKLYNWYAVNDPRGLAPKGWHIPTEEEWNVIELFLQGRGRYSVAGREMKSKTGWSFYKGTNRSGFSGLPGGYVSEEGFHGSLGEHGYWWSTLSRKRNLDNRSDGLYQAHMHKGYGLSVRCIKD